MTDADANLIPEYVRKVERTLADMRSDPYDMGERNQEMNRRLVYPEEGLAVIHQRLDRQDRLDCLDARVTRIEKRLDLVEG